MICFRRRAQLDGAIIAHEISGDSGDYVTPKAVVRTGIDDVAPMVFIIDGDLAVHQSLERLIRTAGWDPEPFTSAEEFLSHPRLETQAAPPVDTH